QWDGQSGKGIIWKTPVPLAGHNSPIVWEDRVFLSGSDGKKQEIYCFDAESGKILWQGNVPHVAVGSSAALKLDEETGYAASTMATDGRKVYAIFATGDVAAFDFKGNKAWTISLGIPDSTYGYASSLDMFRNLLLIQYDQGSAEAGKSKLIALDTSSGRTVWEAKRPVPGSWTSPITAKTPQGFQLITCADPWVIAYDPNNGREIWRADCLGSDSAPSPIYAGGFVFAVESSTELLAIKPDGTGDVTKTHIAWKAEDGIPDITSPVSNGQLIWLLESGGVLTAYQVSDGTKLWEKDFEMSFQASPGLAGESLYLLSDKGVMIIVEAGREFREIARAEMGEKCYATPAFADGRIYIRSIKNLYSIGTNSR
ncbi:MAG: serine/threonine protein kinase, partial [Candidatus Brocadiia bacterium]